MSRNFVSKYTNSLRGFSLIELLVSVAIFSIVMVIAVGALLTMVEASRKAQAIKSVMNNLNFAVESMVRNARIGQNFYCADSPTPPPNIDIPTDCISGGILFAFEPHDGDPDDPGDQEVYRLRSGRIERSVDGGATFARVTADEVHIDDLRFYVTGAPRGDDLQPKVVVIMHGVVGTTEALRTDFNIQTTATQRVFDL
jgi:prepilin-type N-terminal cleavage/methylation domain-containing protein